MWALILGATTVHCQSPVLVQIFPDLSLILVYTLDHFELVEGVIDVEQGCGCCFEGIQKSVVRFAQVVSKALVALVDVPGLKSLQLQNRATKENIKGFSTL